MVYNGIIKEAFMDKKEIIELKQNIDSLIDGIDPQSKLLFGEDSVLKSEYNRDLLVKVSSVLEYLVKVGMVPSVDKRVKFDFYLTPTQRELIEISEDPISISKFVFYINGVVDSSKMKKLPATAVTAWLVHQGYLTSVMNDEGMQFKVLTEKSSEIGLVCEEKTNSYGNKYSVNLYPKIAQDFILNNLDEIIDFYYGNSRNLIE